MKIDIDKNSWHYKLVKRINIMSPEHSRSYVRYVISVVMTIGVIAILLTAPYIVRFALSMWNPIPSNGVYASAAVILLIIGVFGSAIDFIIIVILSKVIYDEEIKPKLPKLEVEFIDGNVKKKKEKENKEKMI